MTRKKGVTLLEMMITMSIFSLLLGVICLIFQEGVQFYRTGSADVLTFQQSVITMDRMCRELQESTAAELYFPAPEDLKEPAHTSGLVFVKRYPDGEHAEVIGYFIDDSTKEVVRALYNPEYDPAEVSTQILKNGPGARKVMVRGIQRLSFQGGDKGLLTIEIVMEGTHQERYVRTKIRNEALVR
jgi:prepilin-type N-terminal cleavage/methylation domain-containing protein